MTDNAMATTDESPSSGAGAVGAEAATTATAAESAPPQVPYGAWPSPITADQVASDRTRLSFPIVIGTSIWWQEQLPGEGGRATVVHRGADGTQTALLPAPWNPRTRVHEYGGLSYLPVQPTAPATTPADAATEAAEATNAGPAAAPAGEEHGAGLPVVFANFADQRLYLAAPGVADGSAEPVPLTPDPTAAGSAASSRPQRARTGSTGTSSTGTSSTGIGTGAALGPSSLRYADFVLSPDRREIWCVRERHERGKVTRAIVAVPLDGSAAADPGAIRVLVSGSDFFAFPTPSPDGQWLAWICWNHPHMPWDGTELRVAPMQDGMPAKGRLIKGSNRESVMAPVWRDNGSLYVATDWTGWWNIYQIGMHGEPPQALYPADEEFADPLWELGARPFARLGDGRLAVRHGRGGARLGLLDPETSETSGGWTVLKSEFDELPDLRFLPIPRKVELEGPYGRVVHALVFPPANPDVVAPPGELPPYVVWIHGGPTSLAIPKLSLEKAYFTSRGIGIIDVNYGGSTGYGRLYRNRLNREWGVVDVADAKEAARSLAKAGEADVARLGIRGGSAGGWTALAAVTTGAVTDPVFSAAVSYYGVADLRGFADHTHDFESRYLDGLIGPLPGFDTVYAERAPVGHVNPNTCPVLLLQGLDDPVVPAQQSESIAADLAAHGIRHAYIAFEGESHGFRKADSMITSLEAELSFYGQVLGFTPPNVKPLTLIAGKDTEQFTHRS
jgi:dipeptidyl aminopeptidase/acylaminoacyl peptidase